MNHIIWCIQWFYELLLKESVCFLLLWHNLLSRVSCQKGPTRNAYAWQIGPFWQDTLDIISARGLRENKPIHAENYRRKYRDMTAL